MVKKLDNISTQSQYNESTTWAKIICDFTVRELLVETKERVVLIPFSPITLSRNVTVRHFTSKTGHYLHKVTNTTSFTPGSELSVKTTLL